MNFNTIFIILKYLAINQFIKKVLTMLIVKYINNKTIIINKIIYIKIKYDV